jgi:hypothetical protein
VAISDLPTYPRALPFCHVALLSPTPGTSKTTLSRYLTEMRRVAALAAAIRAENADLSNSLSRLRELWAKLPEESQAAAHPPEHYAAKVADLLPKY